VVFDDGGDWIDDRRGVQRRTEDEELLLILSALL
jgi:hypothetical protein